MFYHFTLRLISDGGREKVLKSFESSNCLYVGGNLKIYKLIGGLL